MVASCTGSRMTWCESSSSAGLQQRDVELLPLARARAVEERGADAHRGGEPGGAVDDRWSPVIGAGAPNSSIFASAAMRPL